MTKPKVTESTGGDDVRNGMVEATVEGPAAVTPAGKPTLLATLFAGLDEAFTEASARVDRLEGELAEARRDMAAVSALKRIREGGGLPLAGGTSRPAKPARKSSGVGGGAGDTSGRGTIPAGVLNALTEAGKKGLTRADLITKLQVGDDKAG